MPGRRLALLGAGLVVATPLATAGLAVVGVNLPGVARAPFELAGIELPNQSPAGDVQAIIGSTRPDQHGCLLGQHGAQAANGGEDEPGGDPCAQQGNHGTGDQHDNSSGDPNSSPSGAGRSLDAAAGAQSAQQLDQQQSAAGQATGQNNSGAGRATGDQNKIFHGVSDTSNNEDFHSFAKRVGAHPAVLEDFYHWDTPLTTGALKRWHQTRTRGVLSLSTAPGGMPELISPRQIAHGRDDHYLVRLNQSIAASKQVVYIRLFPEMNGYWNPYSAYGANGARKGRSHSTNSFRRAWQRVVLIVGGGKRRVINKKLQQRHMPRILRASSNHDPIYEPENVHRRLPHPKVAFMWTPLTTGSPNVPGNEPGAYWPGKRFVDWVGTDIYSTHTGALRELKSFYRHWGGYPFLIGEYSPWDKDYSGRFTRRLFHWAEGHGRVRMLIYYRSVYADSQYDINHWPKARRVLRHELNKRRFAPYAPGTRDRSRPKSVR